MTNQKGQSLIELLVALGIFVIIIGVLAFFILDSYLSGQLANEMTKAIFLAEEGLEAVRSIKNNSFADLLAGENGLAISGNNWIFQGSKEDLSSLLNEGERVITIEDIDSDRKKITSQISWQSGRGAPQEVKLITYLTNWQKVTEEETCQLLCLEQGYSAGSCQKADKCQGLNLGEVGGCLPPPPTTICCCE